MLANFISSNLRELLTQEASEHIDEFMISDIYYFAQNQNSKIKKVTLEYEDNKIIIMEKMTTGGIRLQLNVDGKNIEVLPQ